MPTKPNEFRAYFTVTGDFDPSEITKFVGMEPTESWKVGDIHPTARLERKFSRWSVYSRLESDQPVVDQIRDVLVQLAPYESLIVALGERYEMGMQTVAYFYTNSPWFHFDADVIAGCAALKVSIDCDFYTMFSDRREDTES
jgi:hypothetical protein